MRTLTRFLAVFTLCAVLAPFAFSDARKDNIDVIIALDKSLSMENKVGAVKDWVNSYVVDQLMVPGDFLVVVAFYGKADVVVSQQVTTDADRTAVKGAISKIRGNGHFTDIGNALDALKDQIASRDTNGREKYVLLLTDGIQEAPPSSRYYSKNGSFNHEFLANTKTIQEKGWKIMILGLGTGTAAKGLAGALEGSYAEVATGSTAGSDKAAGSSKGAGSGGAGASGLTSGAIAEQAGQLFGAISMTGPVKVAPVHADGKSKLTISLQTTGLQGDASITVSGVAASVGPRDVASILPAPYPVSVKAGASVVTIPVTFPTDLPKGRSEGTLTFSFESAPGFVPTQASVTVLVNDWFRENVLLLGGGVVVLLALVVFLVIIALRTAKGRPLSFAVVIADTPVGKGPVSLAPGKEVFLNETSGAFSLVAKRNPKSIARFSVKDAKLLMAVLKHDRFPKLKETPPEARGRTFALRTENGRSFTMKVQSRERKR